jgi:hypothetical protein
VKVIRGQATFRLIFIDRGNFRLPFRSTEKFLPIRPPGRDRVIEHAHGI